jgi:O-antigen ligase
LHRKHGMDTKLERTLVAGLYALLVLSTLLYGAVEPLPTFLLECLIAVLLVLWAGQVALAGRAKLFIPATAYPLLAFLLFGAAQCVIWVDAAGVSHSLSADPEATRMTVLLLCTLCVAFLLFANVLGTPERLKTLVHFLTLYGFGLALFGLLQHFTWNGKFYWFHDKGFKGFGPFHNRNHFAGYLGMLAPLPVAFLLLREKQTDKRTLYGLAATLMGVALVLSLSRGGMVSLAGSLVLVLVLSLSLRANWHAGSARQPAPQHQQNQLLMQASAGAILLVAILAGILWLGAVPVIERVAGETDASLSEKLHDARGAAWRDGLTVFKNNALTGAGLGAYLTVYPTYGEWDSARMLHGETENDYLQVLADTGLVGGALLIWFLVLLARDVQRGLQHPNPRRAVLALGCAGGLAALAIHCFFDFNLQIPSNALLFLLLTALAARLGQPTATPKTKQPALPAPPPPARSVPKEPPFPPINSPKWF